jgi:hypothetical protein
MLKIVITQPSDDFEHAILGAAHSQAAHHM